EALLEAVADRRPTQAPREPSTLPPHRPPSYPPLGTVTPPGLRRSRGPASRAPREWLLRGLLRPVDGHGAEHVEPVADVDEPGGVEHVVDLRRGPEAARRRREVLVRLRVLGDEPGEQRHHPAD